MLDCHGSARCESNQQVKRVNGRIERDVVHNIHIVWTEGRMHGFTKDGQGTRHGVVKSGDAQVWLEER